MKKDRKEQESRKRLYEMSGALRTAKIIAHNMEEAVAIWKAWNNSDEEPTRVHCLGESDNKADTIYV
jgi:hypothetical protein